MDMIERYIAAVQRELPESQREDIGRELKANILDQVEARETHTGSVDDEDVAELLKAMGHPREVAVQFCPPKPLISASYMRLYQHTLSMVLGVMFVIAVIEVTGRWLGGAQMTVPLFIKGLLSHFIGNAVFAFTVITITYALISRNQTSLHAKAPKWEPAKLPAAGKGWHHISLQDIFSDLATLLFLIMVIWYPIWQSDGLVRSVFTEEALTILTWFTPVLVVAIAHSLWQLRVRLWTKPMLLLNMAVDGAFVVAAITLLFIPLVDINQVDWPSAWGSDAFQRIVQWILVGIALVAGYGMFRDLRRLLRF